MNKFARTIAHRPGRHAGDPQVIRRGASAQPAAARLARGLGWLSVALGLVELVAPRRLARALGMPRHEGLLRGYGARELASGIAVLSVDPRTGLAARVGGDLVDLATLALLPRGGARVRRNVRIAMAAVAGVALLDVLCAAALQRRLRRRGTPRDYSARTGFGRAPDALRGAASGFALPPQYRAELPRPRPALGASPASGTTH